MHPWLDSAPGGSAPSGYGGLNEREKFGFEGNTFGKTKLRDSKIIATIATWGIRLKLPCVNSV